ELPHHLKVPYKNGKTCVRGVAVKRDVFSETDIAYRARGLKYPSKLPSNTVQIVPSAQLAIFRANIGKRLIPGRNAARGRLIERPLFNVNVVITRARIDRLIEVLLQRGVCGELHKRSTTTHRLSRLIARTFESRLRRATIETQNDQQPPTRSEQSNVHVRPHTRAQPACPGTDAAQPMDWAAPCAGNLRYQTPSASLINT